MHKNIDHNNNEFRSVESKCRQYKIASSTYRLRKSKGWSEVDALTKPIGNTYLYNGKKYNSIKKLCADNNIPCYSVIYTYITKGMSAQEAMDYFKDTHIFLKETNSWYENFKSCYKDLCKIKGIAYKHENYVVARRHYRKGFSFDDIFSGKRLISEGEEAIEKELKSLGVCYEHDNQAYRKHIKITEIKYRGFRFDFFFKHKGQLIAIEFDGEQHFDPNCFSKSNYKIRKNYFDKVCNQDEKKNQMCKEYRIALCRIRYDQKELIPQIINDVLADPKKYLNIYNPYLNNEEYYAKRKEFDIIIDPTYGNKPYYEDGYGNKFVTLKEMCEFHGMSRQTYRYRTLNGMTTRQALSKKVVYGSKVEYKGKKYKSFSELCRDNNIPYSMFHSRLSRNWPLLAAIETPKLSMQGAK